MARIMIFDPDPAHQANYPTRVGSIDVSGSTDVLIALQRIQAERPKYVFIDWFCPAGEGARLLEEIRKLPESACRPAAVLMGDFRTFAECSLASGRAHRLGALNCIVRPSGAAAWEDTIRLLDRQVR